MSGPRRTRQGLEVLLALSHVAWFIFRGCGVDTWAHGGPRNLDYRVQRRAHWLLWRASATCAELYVVMRVELNATAAAAAAAPSAVCPSSEAHLTPSCTFVSAKAGVGGPRGPWV